MGILKVAQLMDIVELKLVKMIVLDLMYVLQQNRVEMGFVMD